MGIDARIPMSGTPAPQIDVMGSLSRIAQMKRLEAISQQEQRVAAQQDRAAQEDEAFRQVISSSPDIETATPKLLAINPERAQKFLQAHGQLQKTSAETSAFTRAQQEDEQFRVVLQESGGDLNMVIPKLMAINPKRTLEFIKLQHEAQGGADFSTETTESGEIKAFNKRTGTFTPTGERAQSKAAASGTLEAQNVAKLEAELGRPLSSKELEQAHGRWGKADDRPRVSVSVSGSGSGGGDAKAIAQAIISGDQPPELTGLYRFAAPVRAELARQGYNLTKATEDWKATQKYLNTLNGAQQTRLRQAISFTKDSLDVIDDLNKQWQGGKFPLLNRGQLALAKNGVLGPKAATIATQLEAQIGDLVSELGTVYKGGNSSTDESLKLAAQNLKADWSQKTLTDAVALARRNLTIRENSMRNIGAAANADNAYAPKAEAKTEKSVTQAELAAIAKRRGTTVEQEKTRAATAGYVVR